MPKTSLQWSQLAEASLERWSPFDDALDQLSPHSGSGRSQPLHPWIFETYSLKAVQALNSPAAAMGQNFHLEPHH